MYPPLNIRSRQRSPTNCCPEAVAFTISYPLLDFCTIHCPRWRRSGQAGMQSGNPSGFHQQAKEVQDSSLKHLRWCFRDVGRQVFCSLQCQRTATKESNIFPTRPRQVKKRVQGASSNNSARGTPSASMREHSSLPYNTHRCSCTFWLQHCELRV